MSKTILAQVDGFTPVIDTLVDELGIISAVVFGLIWRYCQMSDGVCNASLEKIAKRSGLNKASVMRHAKKLCKAGYLIDHTPELRNVPHTYSDTGKAGLSINLTVAQSNATVAQSNATVAQSNATVAQSNATVAQSNATVAQSKLKKELKKDIKDNEEELAKISRTYESVIGIINPIIADELREAVDLYPSKWIMDAIKESAVQNKHSWKYISAILTRWKAQGNQEAITPMSQRLSAKPTTNNNDDAIRSVLNVS